MKNKVVAFVAFVLGGGVGSFVTWRLVKNKYQQIADDEIASVREAFSRHPSRDYSDTDIARAVKEGIKHPNQNAKDIANAAVQKAPLASYIEKIEKQGYVSYDQYSAKEKPGNEEQDEAYSAPDGGVKLVYDDTMEGPRVISPEDFGTDTENEIIDLIYTSDGILCAENGDIPEGLLDRVGRDFAEHFGDYERDSVHIRNDAFGLDYEILKDNRTYSGIFKKDPSV